MKKKNLDSQAKLSLNKTIIGSLTKNELASVNGGGTVVVTRPTSGADCTLQTRIKDENTLVNFVEKI